ncbi:MAG: DUF302 domain-containing protein [Deltaproteobacteria bacterium]|nr:DUF302 domain-containing protein [Deltaproteobacteria bacterium]
MENAVKMPAKGAVYGISRTVDMSYEQAVDKIKETLKGQGFGVLTEIDVKTTLKQKIDQDFTKYVILGACNPHLAYKAFSEELEIGLLLPCNVCVYEQPGSGETVVAVVDPGVMLGVTGRDDLGPVADEARKKLQAALDAL